ncbi:hypothetical protein TorRG33x02_280940 [Trema orientale]|uniref:Uncharacterized protein n=1 Tax=Trema orientale TaxID=63057 RepID=A0A2P5CL81_TREOI|nr:hypothetical protein TorRG33x02_280940 [Trema orientale]
MEIPLSYNHTVDRRIWHFETNDIYSVRSGYKAIIEAQGRPNSSDPDHIKGWWKKLWNMKLP